MMQAFIEQDCTIEHQGRKFTAGGSYLLNCSDGYVRGVVYVTSDVPNYRTRWHNVTSWHGEIIARAEFGQVYQGNFCKMQAVSFTYAGIRFTGRYCPDWSQAVKVRSTKQAKIEEEGN